MHHQNLGSNILENLGYEGTKLEYLGVKAKFFYQQHDALADCHAGVELLRRYDDGNLAVHQREDRHSRFAVGERACF